ncbi:MAG: ribonuclease P protein component [Lachnospiraceae bacterium]|nr:ribonuclease P protein component [Lachnospiraceae bacterium]
MKSKFQSLKKNQQFRSVYRNGVSKVNRLFVMLVIENDLPYNRVGISVSKKVGNSVIRHRVTRVIREVVRLHWEEVQQGHDIVIVARSTAKEFDYQQFERAIMHLLKLHHLLKEDSE